MQYENGVIIIPLTSELFGSDFNAVRFCSTQLSDDVIVTVDEEIADAIPAIATASVGQTIKVSAVDENGKPTAWEAAPLGLRKIIDYTTEEETVNETVGYVEFFTDIDGNPFSMKNCLLKFCGTLVNETDNDYHLRMDFLSKYTGKWYEFKPAAKNKDFAFCLMVSIDEQGRLSFIEGSNKGLSDVSSHGITAIDKITIYTNNIVKTHIAAGAHIQVWEVM
jgi:hypothetical protein